MVIGVLDPNDTYLRAGELRLRKAGIEIARFDPDLMAQIEELNREFDRERARCTDRERSRPRPLIQPTRREVGPNGHRVGYTDEGDKVEWIPDDDDAGRALAASATPQRQADPRAYNELWDKVWWNRHQTGA